MLVKIAYYAQTSARILLRTLTSKYVMWSHVCPFWLMLEISHYCKVFSICFVFSFQFFLSTVMHIISVTDFPLFCSNSARRCLILCRQNARLKNRLSLYIMLEIYPSLELSELIISTVVFIVKKVFLALRTVRKS